MKARKGLGWIAGGMLVLLILSGISLAKEEGDMKPLEGKKICLDPGHGGPQTGAVGRNRLTEKEVNLKEVMMLKEMLEEAGAEVVLTRSDDSNVSLGDRWKLNREQNTDLFVSLHHNANAHGDASVNRTEVFYHWHDRKGPSVDMAYHLYRELQSLLDLPDSKVYMCWAYAVLRENSYPAVLAEPSYLQNPGEAKKLEDEEYLRSITEAYYRAILAFFKGGRPSLDTEKSLVVGPGPEIRIKVARPAGTALVDPQRFLADIDNRPVKRVEYDPDTGDLRIILPEDLLPGKHQVEIGARNIAGHISDILRMDVTIPEKRPVIKEKETKQWFQGILGDKTVVIDPRGGGDEAVAIAENGLRAATANLETGLFLYDYLNRFGANVSMTRRIDRAMDNVSRVRFALERNPDVFLTISHRLPEPGMGEKPGQLVSRVGSRWSGGRDIGKEMIFHLRQLLGTGKELGDPTSREPLKGEVHGWSSWEVMHAGQEYMATNACPMMFDGPGVPERLLTTAACRKEALALFYGLLDFFGLDDRETAGVHGVVKDKKQGIPIRDALVFLDDELITQTEDDGIYIFKFLDSGKHELKVMAAGFDTLKKEVQLEEKQSLELDLEME